MPYLGKRGIVLCVTVVVFAVMVWHSFSWLYVILAVCWLTFIGFTPIFGFAGYQVWFGRFHLL